LWETIGPAETRQIFLRVLKPKRTVQRDQNVRLLVEFLRSKQGLGKFAATVAAESGRKVETVQTAIMRAQKRMRKDKDFESEVRDWAEYNGIDIS
jgi:hypothetical protein